jgi:hypothetical protein
MAMDRFVSKLKLNPAFTTFRPGREIGSDRIKKALLHYRKAQNGIKNDYYFLAAFALNSSLIASISTFLITGIKFWIFND